MNQQCFQVVMFWISIGVVWIRIDSLRVALLDMRHSNPFWRGIHGY